MPEIQFLNVSKYYNPDIIAVEDLNFTIYNGEYLSLLGPSGCGKTTALRLLSGLIKPSKGQIKWDGSPIQEIGPEDREIGYVFQQFAIFPHLTAYENIAFGPSVKGIPEKDIEDVVEKYIKIVGLSKQANYLPRELEAADLQRIGIARVLASGAKTLLLDEPMGALDFKIREKFQDELRRLVKELNLTAIHVTHDQSEAMAISDRIGVMKKGRMIQLDSPKKLLFNPQKIFAAHFIGESDFFEGVVIKTREGITIVELLGDEEIQIPNVKPLPFVGERVVVGVRREFFELLDTKQPPPDKTNILSGQIISDRFLGEKRRTRIKLMYGRQIEIKRNPNQPQYQAGQKVWIKIPIGGAFLFKYPDKGLYQALSVT